MATTVSISSNYAGKLAAGYVAALVRGANTIEQDLVTLHEAVKYKLNVANLDIVPTFVNGACDFTDAGTITRTEVVLEPKLISAMAEICKLDLRASWEAEKISGELNGRALERDFATFLIDRLILKSAFHVERGIWQGTNTAGDFVGLLSRMEAQATVKRTIQAVTAANVISMLGIAVDAVPATVWYHNAFKIIVSQNVARAYQRALGLGQVSSQVFINSKDNKLTAQEIPMVFEGKQMFVAEGLPDNVIVCAPQTNLHVGTNLLSDVSNVAVKDMFESDLSENVRMKVQFEIGTQLTQPQEIVYARVTGS